MQVVRAVGAPLASKIEGLILAQAAGVPAQMRRVAARKAIAVSAAADLAGDWEALSQAAVSCRVPQGADSWSGWAAAAGGTG